MIPPNVNICHICNSTLCHDGVCLTCITIAKQTKERNQKHIWKNLNTDGKLEYLLQQVQLLQAKLN